MFFKGLLGETPRKQQAKRFLFIFKPSTTHKQRFENSSDNVCLTEDES